jgi:4-amino-4-deoxy-L-arabinose transferase-like glycosyltransferase
MTAVWPRPLELVTPCLDDDVEARRGAATRLRGWVALHARSLAVLGVLLPAVAVLHAWNMYRSPAINITDDEGTYVSQAWAVGTWHELTHYTYWYDHPPLGWIQIAGYAWATGAWSRAPYSLAAGREFMLVVDVLACALLFVLARRLSFRRWTAAAAVVLFAASPLALHYHRMVWLDNIAVLWLLAALVLAASRRRSLASAFGAAACLAVAILSKETVALLAPVVGYVLWQHSDVLTRRYRLAAFATLAGALTFFYPLYALLKDELLQGPGHVSLMWAIRWQLMLREPNGSVFTEGSGASDYFRSWTDLDPWLLY